MIEVNATEFKNNLRQYLQNIYREPVVVHKMGRPTAVLLSYEEYTKLALNFEKEKTGLYETVKEQALQTIRKEFKKLQQPVRDRRAGQ